MAASSRSMDSEHKYNHYMDKSWESLSPRDLAVSFRNLGVSTLFPPRPILNNISGFVKKGGITAVMGASAAGKSLLLRVLAGREPGLHFSGDIFMDGKVVDPKHVHSDITYVPHDEFLINELTVRETVRNAFRMKRDEPDDVADAEVNSLLKKFGMDTMADKMIGTMFKRILSGGQRKRVEVCSELIAPSSLLLLDEPLSGLDGGTAYDILLAMKNTINDHQGNVSILMTIHQPNSRVVDLFDHVLLLNEGGMLFFGTMKEAVAYFSEIGFPADTFTPTDVFLRATDPNFGVAQKFDFEGSYASHALSLKLKVLLDDVSRYGATHTAELVEAVGDIEDGERKSLLRHKVAPVEGTKTRDAETGLTADETNGRQPISIKRLHWRPMYMFVKQYYILLFRHLTLAYRDSSLYYLQFVLSSILMILASVIFLQARSSLSLGMNNRNYPVVSFIFALCYCQIFKVFYLHKIGQLSTHEKANNTYHPLAFWLAELTASCIFSLVFIPGIFLGHLLCGFPLSSFSFQLFVFWLVALTTESMLNLLSKLISNVTTAIFVAEVLMLFLSAFNGQTFVLWKDCPTAWRWLQDIAVIGQGSRAALIGLHDHFSYMCPVDADGVCTVKGKTFRCTADPIVDGMCKVTGREGYYVWSGFPVEESKWTSFGHLAYLCLAFCLLVLVLDYFPIETIVNPIRVFVAGLGTQLTLDLKQDLRRVRGQMNAHLITHAKKEIVVQAAGQKLRVGPEAMIEAKVDAKLQRYLDPTCTSFEPLGKGCTLEWKDLTVTLKDKAGTVLVNKVSGAALPGRILALMGPSGAGKTTFLNALSNRTPFARLDGEVTFGKRTFLPSDLMYMPQFDEFNPNLTVLEQIMMVGELKCANRKEMLKRLYNLLNVLGLSDKVNRRCGDLTAGEIKRVSVGMGLITNPNVLFLDELDSSAAYSIVKFLNILALKINICIVIAIHQPAPMVFDLIHDVYLLYSGGRLAYYGAAATVAGYFSGRGYPAPVGVNATDYMMDLMNRPPVYRGRQTDWTDIYEMSSFARNFRGAVYLTIKLSTKAPLPPPPPGFFTRLLVMIKFFVAYYLREPGMYWLRIMCLVGGACYAGSLFYQLEPTTLAVRSYLGAVYYAVWTTLLIPVASTQFFAADFSFMVEQIKNAVTTPELYCISQFLVSLPFNFLAAVVFQSIFHYMIDIYPATEEYYYGIVMAWGHLLLMEASMLCAVTYFKSAMLAVTSSVIMLNIFFLLTGFVVPVHIIHPALRWITYTIPTKYSLMPYIKFVFGHQSFAVPGVPNFTVPGSEIIAFFKLSESMNPWEELGTLFVFIIAIRVCHFLLLWAHVFPYVKHQLTSFKLLSAYLGTTRPASSSSIVASSVFPSSWFRAAEPVNKTIGPTASP